MDGSVRDAGLGEILGDHILDRPSCHPGLELRDEETIVVDGGTGFQIRGECLAGLVIERNALDPAAFASTRRCPSS